MRVHTNEFRGVVGIMASVNDVLQANFYFRQAGIEALIVQFFKVTAISSSDETEQDVAYTLQQIMGTELVPLWLHGSAEFYKILVLNVSDGLGYAELLETFTSEISGDPMPRYEAISLRQSVPTRLTRGGFKRLPFGAESQSDGINWTLSEEAREPIIEFFENQTIVVDYDDPHEPTGTIVHPVIVGRTLNEAIPPVYELDLSKVQLVSAVESRGWTTQNTRKK